jgi:cation diffusion facilitator family transporter
LVCGLICDQSGKVVLLSPSGKEFAREWPCESYLSGMFGIAAINRRLISFLLKRHDSEDPRQRRMLLGAFEGKVSVLINIVLFLVKLVAGLMIGSAALLSDAVHSLSDCLTSIVVIVGFHFSHKEADNEHPFGHGRAEHVSTLIIAILLIIGGLELAHFSVDRLLHGGPMLEPSLPLLILVALTIFIKEGLADFSQQLGKRFGSDSLVADAWHHRLDAISTALVLVALLAENHGYKGVDAVAGIAVALLVIWSGFGIARGTVDRLMGKTPEPELLDEIHDVCHAIQGVEGIHEVIVHDYGWNRHISLHVEVSMANSLMSAHEIAEDVETVVTERFEAHTTVHVDPIDLDDPLRKQINFGLKNALKDEPELQFHDVRIRRETKGLTLTFGLVWPPGADIAQMAARAELLKTVIHEENPDLSGIDISLRRRFHQ